METHITQTIRRLLTLKGVTQAEAERQVGLARYHLSKILNGRTRPSPMTVSRLAVYFGVDPGEIDPRLREVR